MTWYEKMVWLPLILGLNIVFKDVCWCQVGKGWNLSASLMCQLG